MNVLWNGYETTIFELYHGKRDILAIAAMITKMSFLELTYIQ